MDVGLACAAPQNRALGLLLAAHFARPTWLPCPNHVYLIWSQVSTQLALPTFPNTNPRTGEHPWRWNGQTWRDLQFLQLRQCDVLLQFKGYI